MRAQRMSWHAESKFARVRSVASALLDRTMRSLVMARVHAGGLARGRNRGSRHDSAVSMLHVLYLLTKYTLFVNVFVYIYVYVCVCLYL